MNKINKEQSYSIFAYHSVKLYRTLAGLYNKELSLVVIPTSSSLDQVLGVPETSIVASPRKKILMRALFS